MASLKDLRTRFSQQDDSVCYANQEVSKTRCGKSKDIVRHITQRTSEVTCSGCLKSIGEFKQTEAAVKYAIRSERAEEHSGLIDPGKLSSYKGRRWEKTRLTYDVLCLNCCVKIESGTVMYQSPGEDIHVNVCSLCMRANPELLRSPCPNGHSWESWLDDEQRCFACGYESASRFR